MPIVFKPYVIKMSSLSENSWKIAILFFAVAGKVESIYHMITHTEYARFIFNTEIPIYIKFNFI